jgi:hypothetical protein
MSDYKYNLAGAHFVFFFFNWLVRDLNYVSWPVKLTLLQDTGRIFYPAPRARMRIEKFLISHPNDMKEFIFGDVLSA